MKALVKNPFFYLALAIGAILLVPTLFLKTTGRGIFTEYVLRFHKVETPAITPDMAGYHPSERGHFNAADFVHFKLELLNALNHAVPGKEAFMENLIYLRFNITRKELEAFMKSPENQKRIKEYLNTHPKWKRKIQLALQEAEKKGTRHPFQ